jgi:hypothetical protein
VIGKNAVYTAHTLLQIDETGGRITAPHLEKGRDSF